jgi:hypothetical protein
MISIFNGRSRHLGVGGAPSIYAQVDVQMREHLHLFKGAKLAVFLAVALHADGEGRCFPSVGRLARETGYNVDTVRQALSELREMRLEGHRVVCSRQRRSEQGQMASNEYLVFPSDDEAAEWEIPVEPSTVTDLPSPEKPVTVEPVPVEPLPVNHPDIRRTTINENQSETRASLKEMGESLRVAPDSPGQAAVVDEVKAPRPAPLKAPKPARPATFEEWLAELKASPTYAHVDIDGELGKCVEWCRVNRKEATQGRFLNWINRVPKPIPDSAVSASEPDPELVAGLAKAGLDAATARRMAIKFPDEAKKQLAWLPKREGINAPGLFLRKAIEGSYPAPLGADPAPSQRPAVVAPKAPRPIPPHWLPGVEEVEARDLCNEAAKNLRLHNDPVTDDAVCRDARRIWEQRHRGETPPWADRRAPVRPAVLSAAH